MKKSIFNMLQKLAKQINHSAEDIYDFEVIEQNGQIILIDHTEESYYLRWMLKDFEKALEEKGLYLECECPGRYIVCE